nr:uncharacterized protein LOC115124673 [Oncorhynchus nerka]
MSLRTAGSVLVVFLWSVAVLLGQDGWSVKYITQSTCVLKGSTVEMSCCYTSPSGTVTTTFWFTRNDAEGNPVTLSDEPDYTGHVTYCSNKKNGHTLTIRDLRECDSAMYKFRFITDQTVRKYSGDPGVTLTVTALSPQSVHPDPNWETHTTENEDQTLWQLQGGRCNNGLENSRKCVGGLSLVCDSCTGSGWLECDLHHSEYLCLEGVNSGADLLFQLSQRS